MKEQAIKRINTLRAFYKTGPVFTEWVNFNRQRRQRLNYMRALSKNGYLYTYRLRKAHADAYLLDQMEPVINDGELIVGLPDLAVKEGRITFRDVAFRYYKENKEEVLSACEEHFTIGELPTFEIEAALNSAAEQNKKAFALPNFCANYQPTPEK